MLNIEPRANIDPLNFLLKKKGFIVSYNEIKGIPNYVIWDLKQGDFGDAKRFEIFFVEKLPKTFYKPRERAYLKAGFDRGHICPAEDRSSTTELIKETFYMSNIAPQYPFVNQKTWRFLEEYCRKLVEKKGISLEIASGTIGEKTKIANGFIVVPSQFWKVIKTSNGEIISVIIPNDENIELNWQLYKVEVAEIEKKAGIMFRF